MKRIVYTGIFGDRDELHEPKDRSEGVEYVCFTDDPTLATRRSRWDVRVVESDEHPILATKRYKILAHHHLKCDASLWIDANFQVLDLGKTFKSLTDSVDMVLVRHPTRRCIYDEARRVLRAKKDKTERIERAVRRYRRSGHPTHWGLFCGGFVLRRHVDGIVTFNEAWYDEVTTGTLRDQVSLPVVLRRLQTPFATMSQQIMRLHRHNHR